MPDATDADVIDAELVDDREHLPAITRPTDARPLVDRHTILRPGQPIPTTADAPTYTRRDFEISQQTADLIDAAPPANTSRAYGHARKHFESWCGENDRVHLPCTTATFTEYVGHLIQEGKAPATIQLTMSAIRTWHQDGQQPGMKEARAALKSHARNWKSRKAERKAPPIRSDALARMVATCTADPAARRAARLRDIRDAALLTLGWGMLSRRSELANLLIENLAIEEDGVTVRVAMSKTDQEAKGTDTYVPADPDNPATCPVIRVRAWLEELWAQGHTTGPLFRAITHSGSIPTRKNGDAMTPAAIGDVVKTRAKLAGVKGLNGRAVTAHGLRRGPAQEISEAGGDPTRQGRWKDGSETVRKHYVEPAQGKANNPIVAMRAKRKAEAAARAQEESK